MGCIQPDPLDYICPRVFARELAEYHRCVQARVERMIAADEREHAERKAAGEWPYNCSNDPSLIEWPSCACA